MIELKPGDVACTLNPSWFGRTIKSVSAWLSHDGEAEFGHSLIITSSDGDTIEALWHVVEGKLDKYKGKKVIIARPVGTLKTNPEPITDEMVQRAIDRIREKYVGDPYPWWRLPLYFVQPIARLFGSGEHLVCSELVAKYLLMVGARGGSFLGTTPDNLADEWAHWRNFEVLFKGEWR